MIVFADSSAVVKLYADEPDHHGSALDQPRFGVVVPTAAVLEAAARLVGVHSLRAYDAVQLASAQAAAQAVPDCRTIAAFDVTVRAAAVAEGSALLPA